MAVNTNSKYEERKGEFIRALVSTRRSNKFQKMKKKKKLIFDDLQQKIGV